MNTSHLRRTLFRILAWRLLLTSWLAVLAFPAPAAEQEVRIGILSFRGLEETAQSWTPTATWLAGEVPGHRFRVVPYFFDELAEAVARRQVDFVLTNPEHYVLLQADHGLTAVATLMPLADGHPVNRFGGVIFTRAGRTDIRALADLRGKRISAVSEDSMGGYLAQRWTLFKADIDLSRDVRMRFTGMPHDNVLQEVMSDAADAGFVRTGVLERNIREGRVRAEDLRVLNLQPARDFPQMLSTDLYPEWAFAAMPGVPAELRKAVTVALLGMPADTEAARRGGYYGFSPPAGYHDVEALMERLGMHPYQRTFGWRDVLEKYAVWIVLSLALIVLAAVLAARQLLKANRALNAALAETHQLARRQTLLLASLGEGVYGIDRSGLCTFVNPAALAMLGYRAEDMLGRDQHALFHHTREDGGPYPHAECPIHLTLRDGIRRETLDAFVRRDGRIFPVRMTATPVLVDDEIAGAVVVFQDIAAEREARERTRVLEAALQAAYNGIVVTDRNGVIEWANPAVSRLTGYGLEEALGRTPSLLKSGVHDRGFYDAMWRTIQAGRVWHGDLVNRRKDGSLYHEEMTITPVVDEKGEIRHYIAVKQDISERKRMEEDLRRLAVSDPLTGIANRRRFLERLEEELKRRHRYDGPASLLMLDIDHFKQINDRWGHAAGDAVLRHLTELVGHHLRGTDLVGRLGGEEFGILLPGTDIDGAHDYAEHLRRYVADRPAPTDKGAIAFTVSLGVARFEERDESPDDILARADEALYRAKAAGRNRVER